MSVAQYGFNDKEDLTYLGPRRTRLVLHQFVSESEFVINFTGTHDRHQLILDWSQSEKGKWCCENATELTLHRQMDHTSLIVQNIVTGKQIGSAHV